MVYEGQKLDLLNKGDLLISEVFLALEVRRGDRLVLIRDELFSDRSLVEESFWDLKNMSAGVVAFFLDDEKPLSLGWLEPSIDWGNISVSDLTNFIIIILPS